MGGSPPRFAPSEPVGREVASALLERLGSHRGWLTRYIGIKLRSFRRSSVDVTEDDLFQLTWLAVLNRVRHHAGEHDSLPEWWSPASRFRGYLKGVVRYTLEHALRDNWNRRCRISLSGWPDEELELLLDFIDPRPGPMEHLELEQEQDELQRVLENLSATDRAILRLHADGFSYAQIAALLGLSLPAVAKRSGRALARLRRAMR